MKILKINIKKKNKNVFLSIIFDTSGFDGSYSMIYWQFGGEKTLWLKNTTELLKLELKWILVWLKHCSFKTYDAVLYNDD